MEKCDNNECLYKNDTKCYIGGSLWGTCHYKNKKIKVIYKKRTYEDKKKTQS